MTIKTIKNETFAKAKKLKEFVKQIETETEDIHYAFNGFDDCYFTADYENDRNPNEYVAVDVRLVRFCKKTTEFETLESFEFFGEKCFSQIYGDNVSDFKKSVKSFIKSLKITGKF